MSAPIHIRTQIRDAVVRALKGTRTLDERVFPGRPYALGEKEMPGAIVTVTGEQSEISAMGDDPRLSRAVSLVVTGFVKGEATEDLLDEIAVDVETAIAGERTLNPRSQPERAAAIAMDVSLADTRVAVDGEGTVRAGQIQMTFLVQTRTARSQPGSFV